MPIEGISHKTFVVQNLEKTARLFKDVLDAVEIYDSSNKNFSISREKFLLIGGVWIAIMEGLPSSARTYDHIAFKIDESDYDRYLKKIEAAGVDLKEPRQRVEGEGRSIYFYDFDNHLIELHTGTLEQRLKRYASGNE
jgi:fosfomycin resistance protein FosX